jgi:hypothetical protein
MGRVPKVGDALKLLMEYYSNIFHRHEFLTSKKIDYHSCSNFYLKVVSLCRVIDVQKNRINLFGQQAVYIVQVWPYPK